MNINNNRREFLKTTALAAAGAGLIAGDFGIVMGETSNNKVINEILPQFQLFTYYDIRVKVTSSDQDQYQDEIDHPYNIVNNYMKVEYFIPLKLYKSNKYRTEYVRTLSNGELEIKNIFSHKTFEDAIRIKNIIIDDILSGELIFDKNVEFRYEDRSIVWSEENPKLPIFAIYHEQSIRTLHENV